MFGNGFNSPGIDGDLTGAACAGFFSSATGFAAGLAETETGLPFFPLAP